MMDKLEIERLGGIAGFGGSGSRLRSLGTLEASQLSTSDRQSVDELFSHPVPSGNPVRDGFCYRLTRHTKDGSQTVEVPEQHVPDAIKKSVKDEIV
jgi:hypothetical protein